MRYKLSNRYNDEIFLKEIEPNKYEMEFSNENAADYMCVNYSGEWDTPSCVIESFDPSGGPYISIGFRFMNKQVTKMTIVNNRYIIETKNVEND